MNRVYTIAPKRRINFLSNLSLNNILILINVIAFIIFGIFISINPLFINFIAIKPSNILSGKYLWTFFTSMFMHGGFFHIFANMLSLFFVGSLVEKLIGKKRYIYFYLGAGLFASLLFVVSPFVFPSNLNSFAVGASGAIFGLIGFLMIITPNLPVYLMFIPIPVKMKYAAPGMLLVLWGISIGGNIPIGNSAHLGGFIFGIGYGFYLRKKYKNKTRYIQKHFS